MDDDCDLHIKIRQETLKTGKSFLGYKLFIQNVL